MLLENMWNVWFTFPVTLTVRTWLATVTILCVDTRLQTSTFRAGTRGRMRRDEGCDGFKQEDVNWTDRSGLDQVVPEQLHQFPVTLRTKVFLGDLDVLTEEVDKHRVVLTSGLFRYCR